MNEYDRKYLKLLSKYGRVNLDRLSVHYLTVRYLKESSVSITEDGLDYDECGELVEEIGVYCSKCGFIEYDGPSGTKIPPDEPIGILKHLIEKHL